MQVSDALSGLVFCVLGLAIAIANWHMPAPAGLPVSPGMYPAVIGGAMALFGALIAIHGLLRTGLSGLVEIDPWMRRPRAVAAVVAMIAAMVAYVIGAELAGFLVGAVLLVLIAAFAFQDRLAAAVVLAICGSIVIYVFFAGVLRVPLPVGPLEGMFSWMF